MKCLTTVDFRHNELFPRSPFQPDFHTLFLRRIHSSRNKRISKKPLNTTKFLLTAPLRVHCIVFNL